jgi:dTDP-4-amino-4,6-dideoxygalactose transaminase
LFSNSYCVEGYHQQRPYILLDITFGGKTKVVSKQIERTWYCFNFSPLHSAPAGIKFGRVGTGSESMSVTFEVFRGLTRLPVWVGLEEEDLQKVVTSIQQVCDDIFPNAN